jgi:UDP-N-acetylmuramyl pentapeptide phosphotransferase/UDP-N-acetylglucosamine-1-phosphate transferase
VLELCLTFIVSTAATLRIVRWAQGKGSGRHCTDRDFSKPQKFHTVPVPRIGGLGIVLGVLAGVLLQLRSSGPRDLHLSLGLLACAAPAFFAGIVQDFTDTLTPRGRLLATAVAAVAAFFWLGAGLKVTSIPGLDWLISHPAGSLVLTVFTVAGIANSVNIIDGFNGLAAMCVVLMLCALGYVGYQTDDALISSLAMAGIGAVLGFFVWNYPAGKIFLGDGGAYFLGFYVAELSILLLLRNPGEVSPLFPLLVCIYPVFETVFSIYRRRFLRAQPPSMADSIHLHSLVYRRMMRGTVEGSSPEALTRRNSLTSPYLWVLCMLSVVPAVLFYKNTPVLASCIVMFAVIYVMLYWRIVRFKSPRWLRLRWLHTWAGSEADNGIT